MDRRRFVKGTVAAAIAASIPPTGALAEAVAEIRDVDVVTGSGGRASLRRAEVD